MLTRSIVLPCICHLKGVMCIDVSQSESFVTVAVGLSQGSNVFTYENLAATAWTAVKLNIGSETGNYSIDLTDSRCSASRCMSAEFQTCYAPPRWTCVPPTKLHICCILSQVCCL